MQDIYTMLAELRPEVDFKRTENYISDGILDSFDIVTLVTELEAKFDVMIDPLDILPENFESALAIAKLVNKNGGNIQEVNNDI